MGEMSEFEISQKSLVMSALSARYFDTIGPIQILFVFSVSAV